MLRSTSPPWHSRVGSSMIETILSGRPSVFSNASRRDVADVEAQPIRPMPGGSPFDEVFVTDLTVSDTGARVVVNGRRSFPLACGASTYLETSVEMTDKFGAHIRYSFPRMPLTPSAASTAQWCLFSVSPHAAISIFDKM